MPQTLWRAASVVFVLLLAAAVYYSVEKSIYDQPRQRIVTVADYVGTCQGVKAQCLMAVDEAMQSALKSGRIDQACLNRRPQIRALSRGIAIWLSGHPELHPLPAAEGINRAADTMWPCKP